MVDKDGYRSNVAIVIGDGNGRLFWAKRVGQQAWQFPQGGIDHGESVEDALYRELYEEVGLKSDDVKILQRSKRWLRYNIPEQMQRKHSKPLCIGQKQRWFYLQMTCDPASRFVLTPVARLNSMIGNGSTTGTRSIQLSLLSAQFIAMHCRNSLPPMPACSIHSPPRAFNCVGVAAQYSARSEQCPQSWRGTDDYRQRSALGHAGWSLLGLPIRRI